MDQSVHERKKDFNQLLDNVVCTFEVLVDQFKVHSNVGISDHFSISESEIVLVVSKCVWAI